MPLDLEVAAYLLADATLTAILTGGIYAESVIGGVDGFSRDEDSPTEDAFDASGFLLPCLMVKEEGILPFGEIVDLKEKQISSSQRLTLHYFQDRGHAAIDSAKARAKYLLIGEGFTGTYGLRWIGDSPPVPDAGPLSGSTAVIQSFQVVRART